MSSSEEPFFDDRPLYSCTKQEAADAMVVIDKLRTVRKLGGFGDLTLKVKDGCLVAVEFRWIDNVRR